jgi:hypothetical protein
MCVVKEEAAQGSDLLVTLLVITAQFHLLLFSEGPGREKVDPDGRNEKTEKIIQLSQQKLKLQSA